MTRVAFYAIILAICLSVVGYAVAANMTEQNDVPRGTTETLDTAQRDKPPDQIQGEYIATLKRKNTDLLNLHAAFARNYGLTVRSRQKMNSMLEWDYGNLSLSMLKNLQDLADEKSRIETKIKELEKEKDDLYANALSSFHDKMPAWLSQQWAREENNYLDLVNMTYLKVQWQLVQLKWTGEEKKNLDFMLEYYELRRKELGSKSSGLR